MRSLRVDIDLMRVVGISPIAIVKTAISNVVQGWDGPLLLVRSLFVAIVVVGISHTMCHSRLLERHENPMRQAAMSCSPPVGIATAIVAVVTGALATSLVAYTATLAWMIVTGGMLW